MTQSRSRPASVPGYIDHKDDQLKRLRRIEGQVRGLQRMVEADTYCIDILTQVSAATKALEVRGSWAARRPPSTLPGRHLFRRRRPRREDQ